MTVACTPRATVALRSHNDAQFARRTLDMLSRQTFNDFEAISLDDASTDGTPEIIAEYSFVRRVSGAPVPYVPGRTLNHAAQNAAGKYIVYLNLDAVPLNESYLENILTPLMTGTADIVYGNQTCRPNAFELVRKDYLRAFGDGKTAASWNHFFSMASSAVSRELVLENPFDNELHYSEDIEWSYRMKKAGFRIKYVPSAVVEHSHNYTLCQLKKRFYNEGAADRVIFGTEQSCAVFLRRLAAESLRDAAYLLKIGKPASLLSIIPYRFTQKFNYWRGTHVTPNAIGDSK